MDYHELVSRISSRRSSLAVNRPSSEGTPLPEVIGWVDYATIPFADVHDLGGWGGFVERGHRWKDYIAALPEQKVPYFEALRLEILKCGLKRGGDWHQNDAQGVPVFQDGAVAAFTFRAWGDLLAAVWAEHENHDYGYMDFYMDCCLRSGSV